MVLFRKSYPVNIEEGSIVANRRAAVEESNLRTNPLSFLYAVRLSELHVFLAVKAVIELGSRLDIVADARTLHHGTNIDVWCCETRLRNIVYSIFLSVRLLKRLQRNRNLCKCLLLLSLHGILTLHKAHLATLCCGDELYGSLVLTLDDKAGFLTLVLIAWIWNKLHLGCYCEVLGRELLHERVLHVSKVHKALWLQNAIKAKL